MAAKFTDCEGREWELRLRLPDIRRLAAAGLDLGQLAEDPAGLVGLIALDPEVMGRCLWILCEKQADARTLTPDQFAEGFDGAAIEAARNALLEAVLDFFRRPGTSQIKESLPSLLAEMDRRANAEVKQLLNGSIAPHGASPARPELIPAS